VQPVLKVKDLTVEFSTERGIVRAVDHLSFEIFPGETLGVVGESGCGKTVTALALMGLIEEPMGRIVSGSITLGDTDLCRLNPAEYRKIRGRDIAMVFQDPMTALNPLYTIGWQLSQVLLRHQALQGKSARTRILDLLTMVGISAVEKRIDEYPHQLSGGMRQRVMIAMALLCKPRVLLADEPTTALDVTTQAQVLTQISDLQKQLGMSVILVTHDMGVIAETAHRVMVMYCGRSVEHANVGEIFANSAHPYTRGLLNSIPVIRERRIDRLPIIPGMVPDLHLLPQGCRFADRCSRVIADCRTSKIELRGKVEHQYACINSEVQS
jgi:peptide/nickel transport system ATP-binding protein